MSTSFLRWLHKSAAMTELRQHTRQFIDFTKESDTPL